MASQNRTITLTLNANTNGADSVRDLANEIAKLGKKGGDAAPEFEKLINELNALAKQQDAAQAFIELGQAVDKAKSEVGASTSAFNAQSAALTDLKQKLTETKVVEETYAVTVREAVSTLQASKQEYTAAKAAVSSYVAEIGGAKSATRAQAAELKELNQKVREGKAAYEQAKVAVGALVPEYTNLKNATAGVAEEVKKQQTAFNASNKLVDSATAEYNDLTQSLTQADTALQKLGIDTGNIVGEQNRLVQSMNKLTAEADQLKAKLEQTGNTAQTSVQKIAAAFAGTGVQSVNKMEAEIRQINQALLKLSKDASITGAEFDTAFAAGKARISELESGMKKATVSTHSFGSSFKSALQQFGPATAVFNLVSAAIQKIVDLASDIPKVTAEFQTMERSLRILTGSTASARKEMAYIIDVANRVGTDIKSAADGYIKLTAATKGTNLEGARTRGIFEAISGAMGALGASSAETEGALQAVTQMVTKGVVSMEEMRQQLGERLPQSFQATAKELGITTSELNDLIASGSLAAEDVLPALERGLKTIYNTGEKNDTLKGQWAEFTNGLKQFAAAVGDTGIIDGLLQIGRVVTAVLVGVVDAFMLGTDAIRGFMRAMKLDGSFSKEMDILAEKAMGFHKRIDAIAGTAPKTAATIEDMAAEAKKAGREFVYLEGGVQLSTDAILGSSNAFIKFSVDSGKAEKTAEGFATSARKAAEATRASGESAITAANAIGSEADQREAATQVAEKNAAALVNVADKERAILAILEERHTRMAEGIKDGELRSDTHKKELTKLGEEIEKRRVVVDGLDRQAEAQRLLALATKASAEANDSSAVRVEELRNRYVGLTDALNILHDVQRSGVDVSAQIKQADEAAKVAKKLYTDAINDEAFATQAIAKLSGDERQQRDAAITALAKQQQLLRDVGEAKTDEYAKGELQLIQLRSERQAYEDNSSSLGVLRSAYITTKDTVRKLLEAQAEGKDVSKELTAAQIEAAKASMLYSDALKDQITKTEALKDKKLGLISVEKSETDLKIAYLQSAREVALATGNEAEAARLLVEIKKLEIQLARLTAEAKKAEADATRLVNEAKIEEIKKSGEMTAAKRAEIAALEASIKVKAIEAEIAGVTAEKLRQLEVASRESSKAAADSTSGYDALTDSLDRVSSSAKKARNSLSDLRYDQQGFAVDQQGNRVTANGDKASWKDWTDTDLSDFSMGIGAISKQVMSSPEARQAAQQELERRAEEFKNANAKTTSTTSGTVTPNAAGGFNIDTKTETPVAQTRTAPTTVNINLAGRSTAVNVASQTDANALTSILKQLEEAANRTF